MADLFPICPHCRADTRNGATFTMTDDIDETISYARGDTMEAREQFACLSCAGTFPAWSYVVGQPGSKKWNLVVEDGSFPPDPDLPASMFAPAGFARQVIERS